MPSLQVDWWDRCKDAFKKSEKVAEVMRDVKDEQDQNVRGGKLLQVFLEVADSEIRKFMVDKELALDESDIAPL